MSWRVIQADVLDGLAQLADRSVQTCITSPPYYGLRDYGTEGQIGLEATPDDYVARLVEVFREVRRVLRDDGTLWLNLGDSFGPGKQLLGMPWRVAFALQADGWILRSEIVWSKPNPMPESVADRPAKAHEQIFLLSKSRSYFYDAEAIREGERVHRRAAVTSGRNTEVAATKRPGWSDHNGFNKDIETVGRNKRSVWEVPTQAFPGAHFAVFPPKLIEPCVLAGSSSEACAECGAPWRRIVERTPMVVRPSERVQARDQVEARTATSGTMIQAPGSRTVGWEPFCDHHRAASVPCVVLDPFNGAGTTGVVACRHDRTYIGIELNGDYAEMSRQRIRDDGPLLNVPSEVAA